MFSYSNSDEIIEYYFNNNNFFNEKTKNEKENEKKNVEIEIKDFNDYETIYNKFYNYKEEEIESIVDEILKNYSKENFVQRIKINNENNEKKNEEKIQNQTTTNFNNNNIFNNENGENNINLIPTFKNNLDFIDYIEYEQTNKIPIDKEKNNILSNYFNESKNNIKLLEIKNVEELSSYFKINQKKENEITCILTKGKLLIFGDIYGNVRFYSMLDSKFIHTLKCPIKELVKSSVNCFDLSSDGEFLIIGYICGYISIFDIGKEKCQLLINNVHKSYYINQKFELNSILDIKFFKSDKNFIYFYVSDKIGDVYLDTVKKGNKFKLEKFKSLGKNTENFGQNAEPVFLIKLMKFPKYVYDQYPLLNKIEKNVIFVSISNIRIFNCKNDEKPILIIKKPFYLKENDFCTDVNIGIGKVNKLLNNFGASFTSNSTSIEENEPSENELLLITSWGRIIYLYKIEMKNDTFSNYILIGNFINNCSISRIGFLQESIIFLFDVEKHLKALTTRNFNIGDIKLSKNNEIEILPKKKDKAILEDRKLNESSIINQKYEFNDMKFESYNYSICISYQNLFLKSTNGVYKVILFTWEDCLNLLMKEKKWLELLSLGAEIYKGNLTSLLGIPFEEQERKNKIGNYLKNIIVQYVIYKINISKTNYNNNNNNNEIIECIEIAIDFCISIEDVNYLIGEIEPIFETQNLGEKFLQNLEPFILNDRLKKYNFNVNVISQIIELYNKKNKLENLEHLLIHINIECLDNEIIINQCKELNLLTTLIYIYSNGNRNEFLTPIYLLFDKYQNSIELPNFTDYKILLDKKVKTLKEIKTSKQYYGHILLWYIRWCLTGRKFPYKELLPEEKISVLIPKILYWLIKKNVLIEMVKFDPKNYFVFLKNIFTIEKSYKYLIKNSENNLITENTINMLSNDKEKIKSIKPIDLILYIINMCKDFKSEEINLYLNEFILKSYKLTPIPFEILFESIVNIIKNYEYLNSNNLNLEEINLISNDIIYALSVNNKSNFTDSHYYKILNVCQNSFFYDVKLFLFQRAHKYSDCLELLLSDKMNLINKPKQIYNWLKKLIKSLNDNKSHQNNYYLIELKKVILKHANKLAESSIDELINLSNEYLQKEKKEILINLDNYPNLLFNYVVKCVENIKKKLKENKKYNFNYDDDDLDEIEGEEYISFLFITHIKILCRLKKFKEILKNLQESNIYPFDECLQICLDYKVYDSAIFIYEKIGEYSEALNLSLKFLDDEFDAIFDKIKNENKNELNNSIQNDKNNLNEIINKCIKICLMNNNNQEKLWFDLLEKLYKFDVKFKEYKKKDKKILELDYFNEMDNVILDNIKMLLEQMYNYVSIKSIMDVVFEQYKNAEFKEFKNIILKIFEFYGNQVIIYQCTKELLINSVLINEDKFFKINLNGKFFKIDVCDECKQNLINENKSKKNKKSEKLFFFNCGHILHEKCVLKIFNDDDLEVLCKVCRKNEIEQRISNNFGKSLIKKNVNNNYTPDANEENEEEENFKENYKQNPNKTKIFRKLREINNKINENKNLFLENIVQAKIYEIKKKMNN